ncbi:nitroreductase family protein [Aquamicrobium sp. NLF2-7]|uniref:nitroreductase family protein n=1 Tax=Aquamicrobium sp. NLF2-7 TaxID=2918753 RepID=UPI001EFB1458|nr:nitroreductase family protein [Aquamicrobium sp. NLF2-7]MCG8274388.1 nitroreductase family protein [Aquamicrobium sp. NLF2-7]
MKDLNRRLFLTASAAAPVALAAARPASAALGDISLKAALEGRKSSRRFATTPVPEDALLRLLWAANGGNRPESGGLTSPSWRSANDTVIYVATADGLFRHANDKNTLEKISDTDIRAASSDSAFVARAPALLIFVSDGEALRKAAEGADEQALTVGAHVNAAIAAQNVYLACVAEGLGTCLIGGAANREAIATELKLPEGSIVTYIQPVGTAR